ncbi:unnamed protein product [Notodromas monacha]|uniref:Trafficking protein particle complex subunit 11 n=1 Tax=Notodromas monacha TaxID=399045 RepID=A0A7R9GE37_9CRUS|nr:unnamed protein product [Notodromas monacha]CAG0917855.1 unnamed protein product [Notodromas monacha]
MSEMVADDGLEIHARISDAFSDKSTIHLAEFPKELKSQPIALVTFHGLNVSQNPVHNVIWNAFAQTNDAAPVNCVLRPSEYLYPVPKPKQNYERLVPHGIWKRNWVKKHLEDIPAVAVIFCDLDFRASNWPERRDTCVSMVHCLKVALTGRETRIAVVLIQQTASIPVTGVGSEDALTTERVATLCSLCNVSHKSLFVVPQDKDHVKEYAARIQAALFEMSQAYYQVAARNVKAHRLYQQAYGNLLKLRLVDANCHEIKTVAGFLNYKCCQLLFKSNLPRDAILQFKKHVEMFSRKVGPLAIAFQHQTWMSQQFQLFAELFEQAIRNGLPAVQTQHPGFYYQSAAHHVAVRRKEARKLCSALPVDEETVAGMNLLLDPEETMPYWGQRPWRAGRSLLDPDPATEIAGFNAMQHREATVGVKYSEQIIALLAAAMTQFKSYLSSRMKRHLMVQTAEEFAALSDWPKSLATVNHVIWDYRREKWWSLVSPLLRRAIAFSYRTASRADFIRALIEFLGPKFSTEHKKRPDVVDELHKCLGDAMDGRGPKLKLFDCGGLNEVEERAVANSWVEVMGKACWDAPVVLDMTPISGLWEVRSHFEKSSYALDDMVRVLVHVRLHSPKPANLESVSVSLTPGADRTLTKSRENEDAANFSFSSGESRTFAFAFFAEPGEVGQVLRLKEVKLRIVGKTSIGHSGMTGYPAIVDLTWNLDPESSQGLGVASERDVFESFRFSNSGLEGHCPTSFKLAAITPHEAQLTVIAEHSAPALLGEWYPIVIKIVNDEPCDATSAMLTFGIDAAEGFSDLSVRMSIGHPKLEITSMGKEQSELDLSLEDRDDKNEEETPEAVSDTNAELGLTHVEPFALGTIPGNGGTCEVKIFAKLSKIDEIKFLAQVTYDVKCRRNIPAVLPSQDRRNLLQQPAIVDCSCTTSAVVKTRAVKALETTMTPISLKMESVSKLFVNEPCLLLLNVVNTCPWDVIVKRTKLNLDLALFEGESEDIVEEEDEQIRNLVLAPGEKASECRYAVPLKPITPRAFASSDGPATPAMASYIVHWNRASEENVPSGVMIVPLPCPAVIECPLWLKLLSPSHGYLRSSISIAYMFKNRLDSVLDLSITVEASDAFMFSGQSQVKMRLMPKDETKLHYNLFSLLAGEVALPKLKVECPGIPAYNPVFEALLYRSIPSKIFVMPKGKSTSESGLTPDSDRKVSCLIDSSAS